MEKSKEQLCAGVGVRVALLCASAAALAALALASASFTRGEVGAALAAGWPAIACGLVGLYLAAWLLGREAGRAIHRKRSGYAGAIFGGVCISLCSLVLALLLGCLAYVVWGPGARGADAAGAVFAFGLYLMIFVGSLPAVLFGVVCGVLLRWRLSRAGC